MCCLTIFRQEDGSIVFTHNRDESIHRNATPHLKTFQLKGVDKFIAPVDPISNGTWIAAGNIFTAALLNGGFTNHIRRESYISSRGNIIPQLFQHNTFNDFINNFDPIGFEPFTLLVLENQVKLFEIVWDENRLHLMELSLNEVLIFSSSTLYSDNIKASREEKLLQNISSSSDFSDLWNFHNEYGEDHHCYINVPYNDFLKTLSVVQIINGEDVSIRYKDLESNYVETLKV